MKAARILVAGAMALTLVACTTTGEIEGHKVRGTADAPVQRTTETDLHRHAPSWFKISWQRYLDLGGRSYGIFYADRYGRGAGAVSCNQSCQNATNPAFRGQIEVDFKHKALKSCRRHVQQNFPAHKPDCALYAIKDKIVWKGRMPWE